MQSLPAIFPLLSKVWEFPNLVISNLLVVSNLLCGGILLRSFAPFCALLHTCTCALLRSFLRPSAFRTTAFGNFTHVLWPSNLCFWKQAGKPTKKASLCGPPKILGKERKTHTNKARNIGKGKKEGNPKKQGLEGEGTFCREYSNDLMAASCSSCHERHRSKVCNVYMEEHTCCSEQLEGQVAWHRGQRMEKSTRGKVHKIATRVTSCSSCTWSNLVAQAICNAIRANRFTRAIRNWNPYFIACQADSPESLDFPIRANHATKWSNIRNEIADPHLMHMLFPWTDCCLDTAWGSIFESHPHPRTAQ